MPKPEKQRMKTEAFKLLKNGMRCQKIAEKLDVSLRTIQRWAKEIEPIPIKVSGDEINDKTSGKIPQENPNPTHHSEMILTRSVTPSEYLFCIL
jgi:transcriptional antiterminator